MRSVQALLVAAAAAVAAAALPAGYSHTPAGAMRSECVHEVPSGAELVESDSHMVVLLDGVEHARHVKCVHTPDTPILLPAAATPGRRSLRRQLQLPADYDGWLEYTAAQDAGGYNSFLGFFSVPDTPAGACASPRLHAPPLQATPRAHPPPPQSSLMCCTCSRVRACGGCCAAPGRAEFAPPRAALWQAARDCRCVRRAAKHQLDPQGGPHAHGRL